MEIYIHTHEKDNTKSKIPKGTTSIHNQKIQHPKGKTQEINKHTE
jgi:hypothetical protein